MPEMLPMLSPDKFHDECAVFGVFNHPEASNLAYLGLYALQHRGQEASGIVSSDGQHFYVQKGKGLVADIYSKSVLAQLPGHMAIGHNRYSTQGQSHLKNAQPFVVEYSQGPIAIAHNGNLVNGGLLRDELERAGSIFQSTSDTEVIIHLIATSREPTLMGRIVEALGRSRGAYSLLFLTLDRKHLRSHRTENAGLETRSCSDLQHTLAAFPVEQLGLISHCVRLRDRLTGTNAESDVRIRLLFKCQIEEIMARNGIKRL